MPLPSALTDALAALAQKVAAAAAPKPAFEVTDVLGTVVITGNLPVVTLTQLSSSGDLMLVSCSFTVNESRQTGPGGGKTTTARVFVYEGVTMVSAIDQRSCRLDPIVPKQTVPNMTADVSYVQSTDPYAPATLAVTPMGSPGTEPTYAITAQTFNLLRKLKRL